MNLKLGDWGRLIEVDSARIELMKWPNPNLSVEQLDKAANIWLDSDIQVPFIIYLFKLFGVHV